jgi:hypothetical protein
MKPSFRQISHWNILQKSINNNIICKQCLLGHDKTPGRQDCPWYRSSCGIGGSTRSSTASRKSDMRSEGIKLLTIPFKKIKLVLQNGRCRRLRTVSGNYRYAPERRGKNKNLRHLHIPSWGQFSIKWIYLRISRLRTFFSIGQNNVFIYYLNLIPIKSTYVKRHKGDDYHDPTDCNNRLGKDE